MLTDNIILNTRLEEFQNDMRSSRDVSSLLSKYILMGDSPVLNRDLYLDLKEEVAEHFKIHAKDVILVGSGKLGFSIAPDKTYRLFNNDSDLDLAIISPELFDQIWVQVLNYWREYNFWRLEEGFKHYLFQGWIRPDKLPPSSKFEIRRDWWEFFRMIQYRARYGPYKVRAGLYRNYGFFQAYQTICIKNCKQGMGYIDAHNSNK